MREKQVGGKLTSKRASPMTTYRILIGKLISTLIQASRHELEKLRRTMPASSHYVSGVDSNFLVLQLGAWVLAVALLVQR